MTRLRYEKKGGDFSPAETHKQRSEYLRLAAEASYILGHYYKENHDTKRGDAELKIGENLEKMHQLCLMLATSSTRQ